MIRHLVDNQLKLIWRARLVGNRSNRIILAANSAYFEHRKIAGSLSVIENDDEFSRAYAERARYMNQKAGRYLFNNSKLTMAEFEDWRASIAQNYSKLSIIDWFMDVQTDVIGQSLRDKGDDNQVVKAFDLAFYERRKVQRLSSNGNCYLFQIKYQKCLEYMAEKALECLRKDNLGGSVLNPSLAAN